MRRFRLSAQVPKYEMASELAKGIRLFDSEASIAIREGRSVNCDWLFDASFDLNNNELRYRDLKVMFKNSVEAVGGILLD
jgi:hypothetical protein